MQQLEFDKRYFWAIWATTAVLTAVGCMFVGEWKAERVSLALVTCLASFAVGSLVGFIFTIFGDEVEPLGKVRDAGIAVASGLAGVGIAKVRDVALLVGGIQLFQEKSTSSAWFSVLLVVFYVITGFYFMYTMRKLVLNPALAKSRVELDKIQISGSVSMVAVELANKLPQSILLGRDYVEDLVEDGGKQAEQLRGDLFSADVDAFLSICEKDVHMAVQIQPDNVSKAAVLHYYRIYFFKEEEP